MKGTELFLETAVVGVVGFRGYEPLKFFDVVERVLGCVLPSLVTRDEYRAHLEAKHS